MNDKTLDSLTLKLTPAGHLLLAPGDEPRIDTAIAARLAKAFSKSSAAGLLALAGREVTQPLPVEFDYFRSFGMKYFSALCAHSNAEALPEKIATPESEVLDQIVADAPLFVGVEYLSREILLQLWAALDAEFRTAFSDAAKTLQEFLTSLHPQWNVVGRVHFNLAENRKDPQFPFAFLATYTAQLSSQGKPQHQPLSLALKEYAGAKNKDRLLSLLIPVQRAAESVLWLKPMVDLGSLFQPVRWSPRDAFEFLGSVPELEQAGIVVRMPPLWKNNRPKRPQVTASIGHDAPSMLGAKELLDFKMSVDLDGQELTRDEVRALLESAQGLALIRGQWVEVDAVRLQKAIDRMHEAEKLAKNGGVTFAEAMRLVSGASLSDAPLEDPATADWSQTVAGPWLSDALLKLRSPEKLNQLTFGNELKATLRPYQHAGVEWLHFLTSLGLGACLADDMGLGKTVQVLGLIVAMRQKKEAEHRPHLLVAPASLMGNWKAEIQKFAPSLKSFVAHISETDREKLQNVVPQEAQNADLVMTTYSSLLRVPWLAQAKFNLVILDEAQAIKNADSKQTRAAKKLNSRTRIAMTGTPVENRLGDLFSLFDFTNPGLLGTPKEFTAYAKRLKQAPAKAYAPLRELVRPYILRRLKTDKTVIADLPDKTELKTYCQLTKRQALLYQQAVDSFDEKIQASEGIQRRGLVLAVLMQLKQICNHPSQWLRDNKWNDDDSGKLARLQTLVEVISEKQEKVLVFTQFREMTEPLSLYLTRLFGRPGLVLHGDIKVKERQALVTKFQEDENIPYFVLSLKAGGSGLNLTKASHVIHFDRWWNPAVENQATDRAFRIGQTKNVLVHKFICEGTLEEKIDALIDSKKEISNNILAQGEELNLTELDNNALMKLIALELNKVGKET